MRPWPSCTNKILLENNMDTLAKIASWFCAALITQTIVVVVIAFATAEWYLLSSVIDLIRSLAA